MLRGRFESWDFFCSCSGFAEWPLWARTLHCRTHTHRLTSFRHTFLWASKINTADSRLTRHTHALPFSCQMRFTFFIKLRTPHMCEPLWSEIGNTSCAFNQGFLSVTFGHGGAFSKKVPFNLQWRWFALKCWVFEKKRLKKQIKADFFSLYNPAHHSPSLLPSLALSISSHSGPRVAVLVEGGQCAFSAFTAAV